MNITITELKAVLVNDHGVSEKTLAYGRLSYQKAVGGRNIVHQVDQNTGHLGYLNTNHIWSDNILTPHEKSLCIGTNKQHLPVKEVKSQDRLSELISHIKNKV